VCFSFFGFFVEEISSLFWEGFSSMVNPLFLFPSSVYPEPLIRILTNHRFKGVMEELRIGLYISFDIPGIHQLKWRLMIKRCF